MCTHGIVAPTMPKVDHDTDILIFLFLFAFFVNFFSLSQSPFVIKVPGE